jgi:hypothetical protein
MFTELELESQKPQGKPFAIVTKYKTYEADTGAEISDIWEKHSNESQSHKRKSRDDNKKQS